jgi:hypothetical protein
VRRDAVEQYPNWDDERGEMVLDAYDPGTDYIPTPSPSDAGREGADAANAAALDEQAAALIAEIDARRVPAGAR